MTHDDIVNHVTALYRQVNPRFHGGEQLLIRDQAIEIAQRLKQTAEQIAITEAHPAWRIYQEFSAGMTKAELARI